jgi:hypothetical protein
MLRRKPESAPLSFRQLKAAARPTRVVWLSTRRLGYRLRDLAASTDSRAA